MSLRFIDSIDHYAAAADIIRKWNAVGPAGTCAVQVGVGRFGGNSIRIDPLSCYLQKTLDNQASWIVGFAMQTPGLPSGSAVILQFIDSNNGVQCDLRINQDGTLSITRNGTAVTNGQSTVSVKIGAWNYIEMKVTIATSIGAGTAKVQLNGATVVTVATGQSLQSTANSTANTILVAGAYVNCLFDDFYICDINGSTNNDFLGDCRVVVLYPNGAGASTQFSVTGAGTNYGAAGVSTPQNDVTYVSSNTPSQLDLYTVQNISISTGTIKGIQTVVDSRKDDANTRQLAAVVRISATNYVGAAVNQNASYNMQTEIRETNPNSGIAWTFADINTPLQIGLSLVS